MVDFKLYGTLNGGVDDVMHTVGEWANQKYKDVCEELDEANRIIQELKDELESKITSNNASATTVEQYEYEIKGLETTVANQLSVIDTIREREFNLNKDFNSLHTKYEELVEKFINTVPLQRYHDMLNDYFDLVGKIKDGTALEYIKGLK
jgi:hypothetical protein